MTSPLPGEKPMTLRDAVGGMIHAATQVDTEPYELAGQVLDVVARQVRAHCTPGADAYRAGGDTLVYAVADWISRADTTPFPLPTDEDREALDKAIFYTDPTGAKVFRWADDRVVVGEDSFILGLPDAILAAGFRRSVVSTPDPEALARRFHEAYERLAPEFGYKTREASAVPWEDVPDANKRLMIATCAAVSAPPTATVSAVNALLGVNLWDAPSFRADVRIDFDEHGAIRAAVVSAPPTITDEALARVMHADDVDKGRAFSTFEAMDPDTQAWYFDNARAVIAHLAARAALGGEGGTQ